jgi:acyl carrier protein
MEQATQKAPPLSAEELEAERRSIEEQIIGLVADLLPPGAGNVTLSSATHLKEVGLTSLDLAMLTFDIEQKWNLNVKDAYLDDYRTIAEACDLVLVLRGLAPAGKAG